MNVYLEAVGITALLVYGIVVPIAFMITSLATGHTIALSEAFYLLGVLTAIFIPASIVGLLIVWRTTH